MLVREDRNSPVVACNKCMYASDGHDANTAREVPVILWAHTHVLVYRCRHEALLLERH